MLAAVFGSAGELKAKVLFDTKAKYAILIDVDTNSVLFEKNADTPMPPASMSKLMTLAVVFNELKHGRLTLEDEFTVSQNAWRKGGAPSGTSAMFIPLGKSATLHEMLQGIAVQSGNDACIAIAEGIAGSEEAFAELMNRRAKEIGLTNSHFVNSTGLPAEGHYMTARDLAKLALHLIKEYPEYYHYFSQKEFKYRKHRFINRNPLVGSYGADGLKTGYLKEAGYGLVASKVDRGRRLIVVVNGLESKRARKEEARRLLEWGFRSFRRFTLFPPNTPVGSARVWAGTQSYVPLMGKNGSAIQVVMPRIMANRKVKAAIVYEGPLKPPVKKGDHVGYLEVTAKNAATNRIPLYAAEDVAPAGVMWRGIDTLLFLALGWLF